ncbi:alkaline phosphatase [Desertihabitans brevis]|uniref:Alkaline phosphatase n=2 Tax=Desertihabitans brevis TaxID=2268447 RepID=A0A367YX68_9ACTN|nr:alkaline phosphatase [Desertihabitans brevis]
MSLHLSRRQLVGAGLVGGAAALTGAGTLLTAPYADAAPAGDLFTLGVASGDPLPDGVVLWTRLAPSPLDPDGRGGMADRVRPVAWQVAADPEFRRVVRRGVEVARPEWGHSVHAEVSGLEPGREYWYRFRVGDQVSPVGRTKTAPALGAPLSAAVFGFVSCQNFPAGYFTALRHAAEDQLDAMLHLGDYIYEGAGASQLPGRAHSPAAEIFTLADYRVRHAQYKTDPDLQAAHASTPFISVPDDHEVENNWAGDISQVDTEPDQDPAVFRQRRADAFKALYENMPLRRASMPVGPDMQLYRRIRYGDLLDFSMIDTRQYRDDQLAACEGECAGRNDPSRTILGEQQKAWLVEGLASSEATWQIIGNQSITFDNDTVPGAGVDYSEDNWNGYAGERRSVYSQIHEAGVQNVVIVTGDAHASAASDLRVDFNDTSSPVIGTEFLGTSITSGGNGSDQSNRTRAWLAENPHIKFANNNRGYQRVRVSPELLQVDYQVVDAVTTPDAPVRTRATLTVEAGRPGIAGVDD